MVIFNIKDCADMLQLAITNKDFESIESVKLSIETYSNGDDYHTIALETNDFIFESLKEAIITDSTQMIKYISNKIVEVIDQIVVNN